MSVEQRKARRRAGAAARPAPQFAAAAWFAFAKPRRRWTVHQRIYQTSARPALPERTSARQTRRTLPHSSMSPAMGALAKELETLETAFGAKLIKLNYGLTERPTRPIEVERVPDGELI